MMIGYFALPFNNLKEFVGGAKLVLSVHIPLSVNALL